MLQEMTSLVLCVAGDDTPVEYISESLYRLTQEQQALIEKDIAQGGPGTAPDLSVLSPLRTGVCGQKSVHCSCGSLVRR